MPAAMCAHVLLPVCVEQMTADHFVLVGSGRPAYKRAGQVVVGDTLWMSVPGVSQLVPARVTNTQTVINNGLYAPMTLSGSIIVNNIAASVHRSVSTERMKERHTHSGACPLQTVADL